MICPSCQSAELILDTRDIPHRYRGELTVIPGVKGKFCPGCEEAFFDKDDAERVSAAMTAFHKRTDAQYALN